VSLGEWFLIFRRNIVPSPSRVMKSKQSGTTHMSQRHIPNDLNPQETNSNIQCKTTTLPHQITAEGQSKHRDVLYQLRQTRQPHLEILQVSWSTDRHLHVQHNQVELRSALQPEVNKYVVSHYINTESSSDCPCNT
jgi:hypothetical protein